MELVVEMLHIVGSWTSKNIDILRCNLWFVDQVRKEEKLGRRKGVELHSKKKGEKIRKLSTSNHQTSKK